MHSEFVQYIAIPSIKNLEKSIHSYILYGYLEKFHTLTHAEILLFIKSLINSIKASYVHSYGQIHRNVKNE